MTQNASDVEIANQGFAAFRQDLNDVLEDITTLHSGTAAPSTTYANQWWYETDTDKLYIRNEDNDAWIEILTLDQANDHLASLGASITLDGTGNVSIDSGDFTVDTSVLHVDSTNNRVGIGTVSPSVVCEVYGNTNGDIVHKVKNNATGTGARAAVFLDADDGNKIIIAGTSSAYTGVGSWQDAGVIGTASGASGGLIFNAQGGDIKFQRALSEKVRITSNGLTFNGDTAAANALDDYEEGTWTPTYISSNINPTVSYSEQHGEYVKIGRQVIARCELKTNSVSGGSGTAVSVGGLPFTSGSNDGARSGSVIIGYSTGFSIDNPQAGYQNAGTTSFVLGHNSTSTNANSPLSGTLAVTNLATGSNSNFLMATIIYTTT